MREKCRLTAATFPYAHVMSQGTRAFQLTRIQYRVLGAVGLLLVVFLFLASSRDRFPSSIGRPVDHLISHGGVDNVVAQVPHQLSDALPADPPPKGLAAGLPGDATTIGGAASIPGRPPPHDASSPTSYSGNCGARFGQEYIEAFTKTATQYCDDESTARLTCFSHKIRDNQTDSFCMGGPALFDFAKRGSIHMDCKVRDLTDSELQRHIPEFSDFPSYQYSTGPAYIFKEKMNIDRMEDKVPAYDDVSLLIQREDTEKNLWSTLLEIMSLTFSMDVLQKAIDPSTGKPFWSEADMDKTRAVFTDRLLHGPYWDLWRLFAGQPSIRMTETSSRLNIAITKVVLPLPGGSNPFGQADAADIACGESTLIKTYVKRVLDFYKIKENTSRDGRALTLTVIDRKAQRKLVNQDRLIAALQAKHPDIKVQLVDFTEKLLENQIPIAHDTDILVGVHGDGLAHGMFLPSKSAMVEFLPPTLEHKGFANMAKFLGHKHFSGRGAKHSSPGDVGDWQQDDVLVEESEFLAVCDKAIASMKDSS